MQHNKINILLITETPPGTANGFGVTLKCLFKYLKHCVVFTDHAFLKEKINSEYIHAQVPYHRSKKNLLSLLIGRIPEWRGFYSKLWLKRNIKQKFDVVYSFIYSTDCLLFSSWVSKNLNLPITVHIADHCESFKRKKISDIITNCTNLVCITDEMREEYMRVFKRDDIHVIHNGAEKKCFLTDSQVTNSHAEYNFNHHNPFILCFLGGLFKDLHDESIEDIFRSVSELRKKFPFLEFHLYGQIQPHNFLDELLTLDGIFHHGIVMPLNMKYEIMQKAHCFVIPSSFNSNKNINYRFSFPTKLPEFIATGKPIISYGPITTATNRFLENHQIGHRITNRSIENLCVLISNLILNYNSNLDKASRNQMNVAKIISASESRKKMHDLLFS